MIFSSTEDNGIYLLRTDAIRMRLWLNFSHLLDRFIPRILPLSHAPTKSHWLQLAFKKKNKPKQQNPNKIQTIPINNMYDIIQLTLMLHLLVFLMFEGLWLKVHRLAQFWAFIAAAGDHFLMKEENVSHSDVYQWITLHEGTTLGNYTSSYKEIIYTVIFFPILRRWTVGTELLCTQENKNQEDWWRMHQKEVNNAMASPSPFLFPLKEEGIIVHTPQNFPNFFSHLLSFTFLLAPDKLNP